MAYRLTYTFSVSWVGPGMGPIGSPQVGPGVGNAQVLTLINQAGGQNIQGSGANNAIQNADIATLAAAMETDVIAQLENATNIGTMQGWVSGNP